MCAFTTGIVDAHTLHIGNKSFTLSQTKYTTPSLACKISDETWYAPLTTEVITNTLHIKQKNIIYRVDQPDRYAEIIAQNCPEISTDTENYTYDENGRLIGADENVYLKSTNSTQYINTLFNPNQDTRLTIIFKMENICNLVGARNTDQTIQYMFQCPMDPSNPSRKFQHRGAYNKTMVYFGNEYCPIQAKITFDQNKNVATMRYNNKTFTQNYTYANFSITTPIYLYAINKQGQARIGCGAGTYIYSTKIYNNGAPARHFVPVPACMRIGNFVVPENGMWDIVEQKFYGNSGTGSFIYGKDE